MTVLEAASIAMAFLGLGLSLFLAYVLYPQRRVAPAGAASWGLVVAYGVWHLLRFGEEFSRSALGGTPSHAWRTAAYVALGVAMCCAVWLMRLAASHGKPGYFTALGVGLLLSVLPLPMPLLTIAPPFLIAWFYCFHHTFGLAIGRRSLFALALGVATALYLLAIRGLAMLVEAKWKATGWLVESVLILWAGLLWFPIYRALSRFLTRSARVYAEFGQAVLDEAGLILDLAKRMQFLAAQIAARFGFARVAVVFGAAVEPRDSVSGPVVDLLLAFAKAHPEEVFAAHRAPDSAVRQAMRAEGYGYMIPLCDESGVHGMLLLDPRPVAVLGDNLAGIGKMAATIAHEIKNPLSAIKTIVQLMKEDEAVAAAYEKDLGFVLSEVDRLDKAVRQLLGTANPTPAMNDDVDASALIESMVEELQQQASAARVTLESMVAPQVVLRHSNRELVRQIALNLVLNAMQASPAGGVVAVTLDPSGRLTVRDQGPGIPMEMRARVFEPYVTTKENGTGLGLAIVRRNARLLGGDVELACPEQGGTLVTARLC
jgi:signal transduction histidine kinase